MFRLRFLAPWLLLAAVASAQIPFLHRSSNFKTYGRITAFHLDVPLNAPAPADLAQLSLQQFTFTLYPTASSGEDGMIPGNTETGEPLLIPVRGGIYDHHLDTAKPLEFELIKADPVSLPKAPGKTALLVYSVLYTGTDLSSCTGIVQVLEKDGDKLMLTDQISYDCRGGAGAEWNEKKRQLTVRSAVYSLGDKPCCPSTYDHVTFKLDGKEIKTGEVVLNNQ